MGLPSPWPKTNSDHTKDAEGVDIQKTFTGGELTTDDSMADGVAVLQSTTEAPTSKFFKVQFVTPHTSMDTIFGF